jgi:hypothetical protein
MKIGLNVRRPLRTAVLLMLACSFVLIQNPATVVAQLSKEQQQLFADGVLYFNVNDGGSCTAAIGDLIGADNIKNAFGFLIGQGLSAPQAAGVVGNLMQESGVSPTSQQDGSNDPFPKPGVGFGIAQWTSDGRQKNLVAFASTPEAQSKGGITSLAVQLAFLWKEFTESYKPTYESLKATTTVEQAVTTFEEGFERAGKPNMPNRIKYAQDVLTRYGNDASIPTTVPAVAGNNNSGCGYSANCNGTTGNLALLCEARKFDPFGYLWGGGHDDPERFMQQFTAAGSYTQPFKRIVDCSGIETVAIWNAFRQKLIFTTESMTGMGQFLRRIDPSQAKPGDLMRHPGHTEIATVDGGTATFGAHTDQLPPERQISDAKGQSWTDAYVYIGPGSDRQ